MEEDSFKREEDLEEIIRRAQEGDMLAQELLVRRFQARIAGFVYSMLGDRNSVEDIMQVIFIKMLKALPSLKKRNTFQSWLFRIARNSCLDHLRMSKWKQLLTRFTDAHEEIPAKSTQPFSETVEWLLHEIRSLPPYQREVAVLMQNDSLSYQEMAAVLGCSVESVKSRIFRTRQTLNERREQYANSKI